MAYQQLQLISHSSAGGKSKIKVPAWSGSGEALFPGLLTSHCVLSWWKGKLAVWDLFYKGTNPTTLATSCEELTHWKRLWCWEGLGAGEEGDDRGWDGWMASLTRWMLVRVNSGSWWWTGRPGVLRFMGSQRVGHDWAIELNWTELNPTSKGSVTMT